ncbi:hypothetical protein AERO8C_30211 [Aeromonas veronii]|uniref:Uncharacterized protein n=1 Tax=Aeromonas veronii TaxID=654 RepID=A0A653L5I5_AERVE|nr:hypothetical protein AERO8C_30211 [Aeromonas veronii]
MAFIKKNNKYFKCFISHQRTNVEDHLLT